MKVAQSCPTCFGPVDYQSILEWVAFPSPGDLSNPGLPHCRRVLYELNHQGIPRRLEWVAYPFSSGSSRPRSWTWVSCIAGGVVPTELWGKPRMDNLSYPCPQDSFSCTVFKKDKHLTSKYIPGLKGKQVIFLSSSPQASWRKEFLTNAFIFRRGFKWRAISLDFPDSRSTLKLLRELKKKLISQGEERGTVLTIRINWWHSACRLKDPGMPLKVICKTVGQYTIGVSMLFAK